MPGFQYDAPPTIGNFMASDSFGRLIAGPVGSGKTTGCVLEVLRRSIEQRPAPDGYRYTRWAIVRQTLKQLKDTVLKDCQTWLQGLGEWKVSEGTFHLNFDSVRSEWVFIPLEDAEDQARLLSMQLTGAWLSEAIEMDLGVIAPISGRLGRYPSGQKGVPTWAGMIADTNMPTDMTPWQQFMENLPPDWEKFIQPSGLSPNAENLDWLLQNEATIKLPLGHPDRIAQGRKYYERLVANNNGLESDWVKRYVLAQYGNDPSGAAVFANTFRPDFHLVNDDKVTIVPGYPLIIAQDFGRNPWSLICQVDHMGRLVCHEEVAGTNIGLEKHVLQNLKPKLYSDRYMGFRIVLVGDPSGVAKGSIGEESCYDALKRMGLPAYPAPTNDIEPRLRAVEGLLGQQRNGGPALIINKQRCPMLSRAMSGGYRFTKMKTGALRVTPDKSDKEGFSHVADCLQYAALIAHGGLVPNALRVLQPRTGRSGIRRISPASWT